MSEQAPSKEQVRTPWRAECFAVYDSAGELIVHTGVLGNRLTNAQREAIAQRIVEAVNAYSASEPEAPGCDCPGIRKQDVSAHAPNCPYRVIREIDRAAQPPVLEQAEALAGRLDYESRFADSINADFRMKQAANLIQTPSATIKRLEHEAGGSRERGTSPNRSCGTAGQSGPASSLPNAPCHDWSGAPSGATHYQQHQRAYYKRISATEWLVWSRLGREPQGWMASPGTSDSADWIKRPAPPPSSADALLLLKCVYREVSDFAGISEETMQAIELLLQSALTKGEKP